MSPPPDKTGSAWFRTAAIGFNARVEPFAFSLEKKRKDLGLLEYWKLKGESDRRLKAIRAALPKQKVADRTWEKAKGECVCNLRVARMGMLADLRDFAKGESPGPRRFRHLLQGREFNTIYLPVDFERPFAIPPAPGGGKDPTPVGSVPRLASELEALEKTLRTAATFKLKMVDFLDVTPEAIGKYESSVGGVLDFWVKFGFIILRKLVEKSAESGFPILFA